MWSDNLRIQSREVVVDGIRLLGFGPLYTKNEISFSQEPWISVKDWTDGWLDLIPERPCTFSTAVPTQHTFSRHCPMTPSILHDKPGQLVHLAIAPSRRTEHGRHDTEARVGLWSIRTAHPQLWQWRQPRGRKRGRAPFRWHRTRVWLRRMMIGDVGSTCSSLGCGTLMRTFASASELPGVLFPLKLEWNKLRCSY